MGALPAAAAGMAYIQADEKVNNRSRLINIARRRARSLVDGDDDGVVSG